MTIPLTQFHRPYSNIQPFTVRDGATHMLQIETLIDWIRDTVVPHIDTEISGLTADWAAKTLSLVETWEQLSTELINQVTPVAADVSADAASAEAAKLAAEAARDLAEQFASQAAEVQDASVALILDNASSALRTSLDSLYATFTTVDAVATDVAAVAGVVESGRLSETSLDIRFSEKSEKTETDPIVETVSTGRLSEASVNSTISSILEGLFDTSGVIRGNDGKTYKLISCVLRNGDAPGFWYVLDDDAHSSQGVSSVTTTDTGIVVNFDPATKVVYAGIQADETLAPLRYSAGVSLGLNSATIALSRDAIDDFISYSGGVFTSASGKMVPQGGMAANGSVVLRHEMIGGFGVSVQSRSLYAAGIVTMTGQVAGTYKSETTINWRNAAGNVILTPDAACNAYVSRIGGGSVNPKGVGEDLSNANFWFFAIVEVDAPVTP